MNAELKKNKGILRDFMRANYSDARLIMLLDHARGGRLAFHSCCCFVGVSTSDHPDGVIRGELRGVAGTFEWSQHGGETYLSIDGGETASQAYNRIAGLILREPMADEKRRRILIPMILAELKRRQKQSTTIEDCHEVRVSR